MSDREERLLLALLEAECENAELIKQKWAKTTPDEYDGEVDGLDYERAFADGVVLGVGKAKGIVERTINA